MRQKVSCSAMTRAMHGSGTLDDAVNTTVNVETCPSTTVTGLDSSLCPVRLTWRQRQVKSGTVKHDL